MKQFVLAAIAVLSLGIGSAFAQTLTPPRCSIGARPTAATSRATDVSGNESQAATSPQPAFPFEHQPATA